MFPSIILYGISSTSSSHYLTYLPAVPIYNFQNGQEKKKFLGKNRHRPCLDLQYINFKYENCVSLAFKIAKIQGLQGQRAPWPRKGLCRWIPPGAEAAPWTPGHWVSRFWISKCWQVCSHPKYITETFLPVTKFDSVCLQLIIVAMETLTTFSLLKSNRQATLSVSFCFHLKCSHDRL